jgi:hypothetical protein
VERRVADHVKDEEAFCFAYGVMLVKKTSESVLYSTASMEKWLACGLR